MGELKYIQVNRPIGAMSTAQIRAWLADIPDSEVMRSILMAEIQAIRGGAPREARTLRNVWYQIVKPVLSRAGILNKTTKGGKPIEWARKLSNYLAELVRAGATSYEELLIVDGSRQRQAAQVIDHQLIDVRMTGAHYPQIILFTEKDTMWNEVRGLATLYGVSAISGKGEPSFACTENILREIIASDAWREAQPQYITLLCLTDYDPAGYNIQAAQLQQIRDVLHGLHEAGELGEVYALAERVGLEPDQLTADERERNAYEPKDAGLLDWYKSTGGVDGQPLGLELDALDLSQLRAMFADAIERHIRLDRREDDLREAYADLIACELLAPEFNRQRGEMIKRLKAAPLWDRITSKALPPDLFSNAAEAGANWIGPDRTRKLFEEFSADVKRIMQEEAQP